MHKNKNSGEILDLHKPNYGKHWNGHVGYLIANTGGVYFFYYIETVGFLFENVTNEYVLMR